MKKVKKVILYNITILILLLVVVEFVLFLLKFHPGIIGNQLGNIRNIEFQTGYTVDSSGIQKANQHVRYFVQKHIASNELAYNSEISKLNPKNASGVLYGISHNFLEVSKGIIKNDFANFIDSIKIKKNKDEIEQVYLNYIKSPFNTDGFRSIPFKNYISERKKVLLLGDSFTWGHNAKNISSSFPENLMAKGHIVFNTGISGTDLPQYAAIAEEYIKVLQPDIVIVNICAVNDFVKYDRIVSKDVPVYYLANAGAIYSCPKGICFYDKESIIQNLKSQYIIPTENSNINKLAAKTRISSQVWGILAEKNILGFEHSKNVQEFWKEAKDLEKNGSYSVNRKYLERIDSICQKYNTKLITSIIPDPRQLQIPNKILDEKMDGYSPYHLMMNLESSDYTKGRNGHFNEKGHQRYAEYLDSIIQTIPKKQIPINKKSEFPF